MPPTGALPLGVAVMTVDRATRDQRSRNDNQLIHGKTAKRTISTLLGAQDSIKMRLFLFWSANRGVPLDQTSGSSPRTDSLRNPLINAVIVVVAPFCNVGRTKLRVVSVTRGVGSSQIT